MDYEREYIFIILSGPVGRWIFARVDSLFEFGYMPVIGCKGIYADGAVWKPRTRRSGLSNCYTILWGKSKSCQG